MVCCCSLAGTMACYSCSAFSKAFGPSSPTWVVPKSKKIIEKYDKDGKLTERIIEE